MKFLILSSFLIILSSIPIVTAEDEYAIPPWVQITAQYWVEDEIDDNSFFGAIEYLIKEKIIQIPLEKICEIYDLSCEQHPLYKDEGISELFPFHNPYFEWTPEKGGFIKYQIQGDTNDTLVLEAKVYGLAPNSEYALTVHIFCNEDNLEHYKEFTPDNMTECKPVSQLSNRESMVSRPVSVESARDTTDDSGYLLISRTIDNISSGKYEIFFQIEHNLERDAPPYWILNFRTVVPESETLFLKFGPD